MRLDMVKGEEEDKQACVMRCMWLASVLSPVALLLLLVGSCSRKVSPAFDVSPDGGTVVFSGGSSTGGQDLFELDLARKSVRRITDSVAEEHDPAFSPDGRRIAFTSWSGRRSDSWHICLINTDGSHLRQLTGDRACCDSFPAFSPDGQHIAFLRAFTIESDGKGGMRFLDWDLCVIGVDGGTVRRLTFERYGNVAGVVGFVDSTTMVYCASRSYTSGPDLWAKGFDGSEPPQRLTSDQSTWSASVSRTSGHLVYCSDRNSAHPQVWICDSGGRGHVQVTSNAWYMDLPRFASHDEIILFLKSTPSDHELWQVSRDGTGLLRIADRRLFTDPEGWRGSIR